MLTFNPFRLNSSFSLLLILANFLFNNQEAGGHTGDIPTSILTPACADICRQYKSPLTGNPVMVVAAGGINDGRSVASALMLGACGVWIGTRFIASVESKAPEEFKKQVIKANYDSWIKSTIWSGRPLRALSNPYIANWELNRQAEIKELTAKSVVPLVYELDRLHEKGELTDEIEDATALRYVSSRIKLETGSPRLRSGTLTL